MAPSNIALIITDLDGRRGRTVSGRTGHPAGPRTGFDPVVYCLAPPPSPGRDSLAEIVGDGGNRRPFPRRAAKLAVLRDRPPAGAAASATKCPVDPDLPFSRQYRRTDCRAAGRGGEGRLRHSRGPAGQSMATLARSDDRSPGRPPCLR